MLLENRSYGERIHYMVVKSKPIGLASASCPSSHCFFACFVLHYAGPRLASVITVRHYAIFLHVSAVKEDCTVEFVAGIRWLIFSASFVRLVRDVTKTISAVQNVSAITFLFWIKYIPWRALRIRIRHVL